MVLTIIMNFLIIIINYNNNIYEIKLYYVTNIYN